MALKVDYVLKETGKNLVRSPWLTVATIVCVFVSIVLIGAALLTRSAAGNATQRWEGGVEVVVFMHPDATPEQIESVQRDLDENPQVESARYLDHQAAYDEFLDLFPDSPELVDAVSPDALPTNFKVQPVRVDNDLIAGLVELFETKPGVRDVVAANEAIRAIERISNIISVGMVALSVALTIAALVLIGITIQTAIFARRREIEVMKLVGATNWFIRVPFMVEGLLQGAVGALLAFGAIFYLRSPLAEWILENFDQFEGFLVRDGQVLFIGTIVVVVGAAIGAVSAGIAVTRFLDV